MKKKRLLKLAEFLEKLPRAKFDFGTTVLEWDGGKTCGTVCCAIGWTPTIWPELVEWVHGGVSIKDSVNGYDGFDDIAKELFGISRSDTWSLFSESTSEWDMFGENKKRSERFNKLKLKRLDSRATPKQVAKNIRLYVENA